MVKPVHGEQEIQDRIIKFKNKAKHITTTEHLKKILDSFPEFIRLNVFNQIRSQLRANLEFPYSTSLDSRDSDKNVQ